MGHQSGGMADDTLLPAVGGDGGVPVEAHVADLLERAMQALLSDAPDRPVRFLRDYIKRERDGVAHPLPREPTSEPEPPPPPPERIKRSDEAGLPPLNSYYGELIRAKWFAEPDAPHADVVRKQGGLHSNDAPTFHFLNRPQQHRGPVNQTFKQFYRVSRSDDLPISVVAPDAHGVLAAPRAPVLTGSEIFARVRTSRTPGGTARGGVPENVVISSVARDYIAVKSATGELVSAPSPPESPLPGPNQMPRKPMSPVRVGTRPEPAKQWEPGPLLEKYGITEEEALYPKDTLRVSVAHLDADATLMVGGVSPQPPQTEPSSESLAGGWSRSSTPNFAIKQRGGGIFGPDNPVLEGVLRPMVPSQPQAPRIGSNPTTARIARTGRWNVQATSYRGPGSHAAQRLAQTKRGRMPLQTLQGHPPLGISPAGVNRARPNYPNTPPRMVSTKLPTSAVSSPRLPPIRGPGVAPPGVLQTA